MSRSRKKHAIIKDSSNSKGKKIANRRLRRKTKVSVRKGDEVIPINKEVTNQYDVCDYTLRANRGDSYYNKFKRK